MVGPGNLRDLALQWTNVHGFNKQNPGKRTVTVKVPPYEVEHTQYADKTGRVLVETRLIGKEGPATDHGVVIDPEEASFACGRTQDFVYDGNICSTLEIARFLGSRQHSRNEHCERPLQQSEMSASERFHRHDVHR